MEMGTLNKNSSLQDLLKSYNFILEHSLKKIALLNNKECYCSFVQLDNIINLSNVNLCLNDKNPYIKEYNNNNLFLFESIIKNGMLMPLTVSKRYSKGIHILLEGFHRFESLSLGKNIYNLPNFSILCLITSREFRENKLKIIPIENTYTYFLEKNKIYKKEVDNLYDLYDCYRISVANFGQLFYRFNNDFKAPKYINNEEEFYKWIKEH